MPRRPAFIEPRLDLSGPTGRPDFAAERMMSRLYGEPVAGVDEAGRGPWAGPVVAAAVILDPERRPPQGLNDSKLLTPARRERLFDEIVAESVGFGVGLASAAEIDEINIRQATHLAMSRALSALTAGGCPAPAAAIVDGDDAPALACPTRPIVKGDQRSLSIAAASILAKVTRDRLMVEMDREHPGYGFARHKGYGTALHVERLAALGPCAIHRMSFAPLARKAG